MSLSVREHYSIGQLARSLGLTHRAIRYYEECGLVRPMRDGVMRIFSSSDCERMRFIAEARRANLSVVDIRELLELHDPDDGGRRQLARRLQLLTSQFEAAVAQCASLKDEIDRGRAAIQELDGRGSKAA